MQIDFQGEVTQPIWPEEYVLSAFTPAEEKSLYGLIVNAFTWPGHVMTSFETWKEHLFRNGRFDPELFMLVHKGEKLVGAALSYDEGTRGWIRQLAITKELQGKGLGSLLLQHVFSIYYNKGIPTVALGVASENEIANRFYERNGMRRTREFVEYQLNVNP